MEMGHLQHRDASKISYDKKMKVQKMFVQLCSDTETRSQLKLYSAVR